MSDKTIGQAAYEKYRGFINPPWANIAVPWAILPDSSKDAWEQIAKAAINQLFRVRYGVVENEEPQTSQR